MSSRSKETLWPVVRRCFELFAKASLYGAVCLARRLGRTGRLDAGGAFLAALSESLGGAFVKIGQLLSSRSDLLSPALIARISRLRDRLPPFAPELGERQRRALLSPRLHRALIEFDPRPIAAATVAQVHRGRLADGRLVAIKLRRPGLERRYATDLKIAARMARLATALPALRMVPLPGLVAEVSDAIRRQIDFRREARVAQVLREAFAGRPEIMIPEPLPDLSDEACLVTSFVEGLQPFDAAGIQAPASTARVAVSMLFEMVFNQGVIHCDMHGGNLFCRQDGSVVLLDFGFVCELSRADREAFTEFFLGFASGQGGRCARVIADTALALPAGFDRRAFDEAMERLVARHHALTAGEFEVARFAVELFDTQRRFRVTGPTAFTMTIIAFLVLEGIVKRLHPGMDFQAEARRFFIERELSGAVARAV